VSGLVVPVWKRKRKQRKGNKEKEKEERKKEGKRLQFTVHDTVQYPTGT
jgi:hypothetical protein